MHKILVVNHNNDVLLLTTRFLTRQSYSVSGTNNGQTTINWLKKNKPDLVLCDFSPADMQGLQLVSKIKSMHPGTTIIITGERRFEGSIEVLESGACAFIAEPLLPEEMLLVIDKSLRARSGKLTAEGSMQGKDKSNNAAAKIHDEQYVMGKSLEFAEVVKQIALVAATDFSVIIYGKSGTGKEAIAQQIHRESKRSGQPFVALDCGALSKELAGSELFGHEKGAFTGALGQKMGCLEVGNGGTIFFDEIANLSYSIQVSLLRVIQERKMRRVGGTKDINLDVRIILASNIDLRDAVKEGKFREDLYHRFNEFDIVLPSLAERKQDIMIFAHSFLKHTNAELGKQVQGFTKEVEHLLTNYLWPGNIRELRNVIRRAVLLTEGNFVEAGSLPSDIKLAFTQSLAAHSISQTTGRQENTRTGSRRSQQIMTNSLSSTNSKCRIITGTVQKSDKTENYVLAV